MTEALRALLELELTTKYPVAFEGQGRQEHKAVDGGLFIVGCRAESIGKCFVGCGGFPGIGFNFFPNFY